MWLAFEAPTSRADLAKFVDRARGAHIRTAHLWVENGVVGVFVPFLAPRGMLDLTPTVLAVRATRVRHAHAQRRTVFLADLADALAETELRAQSPDIALAAQQAPEDGFDLVQLGATTQAWAGVLPTRSGWQSAGQIRMADLADEARLGAAEVRAALPESAGEAVLSSVRSAVWGASANPVLTFRLDPDMAPWVPRGIAFAATTIGMAAAEALLPVSRSGEWLRIAGPGGDVLCRLRRNATR